MKKKGVQPTSIDSHLYRAEKKRKREENTKVKNRKEDQEEFTNAVSKIIMRSGKKKEEENRDELLEAIKDFLTNIKSPDMVRETITQLNMVFTKENWENHFYMTDIKKLREDTSDDSKIVLKRFITNQSNRFESVKRLFEFVNNIMTLKEQVNFSISASIFMEMFKANDTHINWLLSGINAIISCHLYEPNIDAEKTLQNILNDYIDVWTFYISRPSEKRRYVQYTSMMPEKTLNEIRSTIMNVIYPNQSKPQAIVIDEPEFRKRKKRLRNAAVKIRNSLAFEVHQVKIGLHLTKHLMRNFVTNRSSKDRNTILEKVKTCPYHFYVKFESVKIVDGLSEFICDQIIQNDAKSSEIRVEIKYKDNPELVEENGNFWIMASIDLPFRFTSCNCTIEIPEVKELFDLTTKMVYQVAEIPNFGFCEQSEMKKRIKPLKENVFDMDSCYLDSHYYAYEVTPHYSILGGKKPVRVILEGRPMSELIVETKIKPIKTSLS